MKKDQIEKKLRAFKRKGKDKVCVPVKIVDIPNLNGYTTPKEEFKKAIAKLKDRACYITLDNGLTSELDIRNLVGEVGEWKEKKNWFEVMFTLKSIYPQALRVGELIDSNFPIQTNIHLFGSVNDKNEVIDIEISHVDIIYPKEDI
jgi:hypothetical protein